MMAEVACGRLRSTASTWEGVALTLQGWSKPIGELVVSGSDAALRLVMGGGARVPEDWDDDGSVF